MATITFGGTAGNWSDNTKWVGGTKPSQTDDAAFTSTSANCTYDTTGNNCTNIDFTGYTGTFTLNAALNVYGSMTLVSGMTLTVSSSNNFQFSGSGNVTMTTAGKDVKNFRVNKSSGGKLTLSDNVTATGAVLSVQGELDFNSKTCTIGSFATSGATAKTLTLGSATINVSSTTAWDVEAGGGTLTLTQSGSTINITGTGGRNFFGGGQTYGTVTANVSGVNLKGANTFDTFTFTAGAVNTAALLLYADQTVNTSLTLSGDGGSNGIMRLLVYSDVSGTRRSIAYNGAAITAQHLDLVDFRGTGSFGWDLSAIPGGSGNCGNNSGVTFTTLPDLYWIGDGGNWNDKTGSNFTHWAATDGGSAQGYLPLQQTTAHFTSNSFTTGSQTVTCGTTTVPARTCGSVNWTGVTNSPTWAFSGLALNLAGTHLTLVSGMTYTKTGGGLNVTARNSFTITSAGKQLYSLAFSGIGYTTTLADDCQADTAATTMTRGTLDLNGKTLKLLSLASTATTYARGLTFNGGTMEVSGTGDVFAVAATNFTLTADTGTIHVTGTTSDVKRFAGAGLTYNNLKIASGTSSSLQITDANTFKDIEVLAPSKLSLPSTLTTAVTSLTMVGTLGNLCYLDAITSGSAATISSSASSVSVTYTSIKDSTATGGAIFNAYDSTDATGNTGWNFLASFLPRIAVID